MLVTTLGPLAVDGRPVRGDRLGTVVRELVEARGRAVSVAALVDAVWDGAPPEDAPGALYALVSRVRRLGLPVAGIAGGYAVPMDEVRVDAVEAAALVQRARAALDEGDPAAARRWADEARGLFPAVPDLAVPAHRRLLAEVAAVRAQAALAGTGALDEADLRRLAGGDPPHEPSAALLVRVLAALGRDSEALALVERVRGDLADRYGADPSPGLAAAHVALLRGELAPPAGAPAPPAGVTQPLAGGREPLAGGREPLAGGREPLAGGTEPLAGGREPLAGTAEPSQGPAGMPAPVLAARHGAGSSLPAAWRRPGTALVGREPDIGAVLGALAGAPLVTVVAPGGAGKTRLAGEVARRELAAGRTVRVAELAGLRAADEVMPALLAALGGVEPAAGRGQDRLRAAVEEFTGLLILDNCEHLLGAVAGAVTELLAVAPPELAVLATSRAPLGHVAEAVYRLGVLPDDDAVALLTARTGPAGALGRVDPADGRVRELCRRLDNLPLALELAAARLRHMPIDDVLAGLTDRFALLDDALRGLPDRHASLWTLVDWSRELLTEADRSLLQRLAAIPAPFTAGCAAAVSGRPDVRAGLATLVEQSLLGLDDAATPPRYRMLETVREYGEVRLDAAGERDAAMAGLVGWAQERAVAVIPDLIGARQVPAIAAVVADQDNLLAALRWALARDEECAVVDIGVAVLHLWTVRGLHREAVALAEAVLRVDDPVGRRHSALLHGRATGRPLPVADRVAFICMLAGISSGVVTFGPTRLHGLAARALRVLFAERADEISPRMAALAGALPWLESPDPQVHLSTADRLTAHADPLVRGFGLFARSVVTENLGLIDESAADAVSAYHEFETVGDHWMMGLAAMAVAQRLGARARPGADEWLLRSARCLELVGAAGDARSVRVLLDVQLALAGDVEAGQRLRELSGSDLADGDDVAQAHLGLAQMAWRERRYADALTHLDVVTGLTGGPAFPVPQSRVVARAAAATLYLRLGGAAPALGDVDVRAVSLLRPAFDEALSIMDVPVIGSCALAGAELAAYRGDTGRARELAAIATRLGATVVYQFQDGPSDRLTAALAAGPAQAPDGWRERPLTEALDRLRELSDALVRPYAGTRAAPGA